MKETIEDILLDYGSRDEKGTYTSGQYDLLVSRLVSEFEEDPIQARAEAEEREYRSGL